MKTTPVRRLISCLGFTLLVLLCTPVLRCAADGDDLPPAEAVPPAGTLATAPDWRAEFLAGWKTTSTFGKLESSAPAPGVRLITTEQPENIFGLQAIVLNQIPLHKGDTLLVRFAARSLKADLATGVTKLRVGFSKNSPPWDGSYSGEIGIGSGWERFNIPFSCKNDFAPMEAKLSIMFGYPAQVAEIADVQLIRYSSEVSPATLPKTARRADPVLPQTVADQMARIAKMRKELAAVADPAPARGRTLHVSIKANPAGDGSAEAPFQSIPAALAVVQPGDTILVAAGEYHDSKGLSVKTSGRPDAWIKLKAAPGARPKLISSGWSGIEFRGGIAYIEVEGFELEWVPDPESKTVVHGAGLAPMYASHHLRFLNNVVHGFGTGGICSLDCDYVFLEGNVIYDTAKTSPYGGSAISLCRAFDFDQAPGYHNVIRGNIAYDNELKAIVLESSGGNGRTLTDGNGIIIDVFDRSRANPLKPHGQDRNGPLAPYHGRTLVENNLLYNNGGRGVHIFRSSNVDVVNNTCYMNQKSADINAGEFTAIQGSHVNFFNNLAYGRQDKRGNTQDGSTHVIWKDNLFFNVADVLLHDGIIERDPLFVAPGLAAPPRGFRLQSGSPALGKGVPDPAPPVDLTGSPRPAGGPIDLGAYQESK